MVRKANISTLLRGLRSKEPALSNDEQLLLDERCKQDALMLIHRKYRKLPQDEAFEYIIEELQAHNIGVNEFIDNKLGDDKTKSEFIVALLDYLENNRQPIFEVKKMYFAIINSSVPKTPEVQERLMNPNTKVHRPALVVDYPLDARFRKNIKERRLTPEGRAHADEASERCAGHKPEVTLAKQIASEFTRVNGDIGFPNLA